MFETFADDVVAAQVTTRGSYLKKCAGLALVTGVKEDADRSGKKAVMSLLIVRVDTTAGDTNYVGEKVQKQYRFQDGNADKRAATIANFKRDMCALADLDPKTMTADQFKAISAAVAKGSFNGLLLRFDPYEHTTKSGAVHTYHNLNKVPGKNTPADVAKRADLLTKGAGPEAFL